jgi:hypothetical protein
LLNVKYLLYPTGISVPPTLNLRVTDRSDFGVVENLEVWPRAFFTDRVVSIATTGEFIQRLVQHGQHPFAALTPQEIATQPGLRELATAEPAVILAATNYQLLANSTAFEIHVPSAGVVCLTEGQARDFSATANGEPKTVLTVNRAFKGLYLDRPGDYHIVFTYRPRHWRLACSSCSSPRARIGDRAGWHPRFTNPPNPENCKNRANLKTHPRNPRLAAFCSDWNTRHPVLTLVLVSLLAVIINCHPSSFVAGVLSPPPVWERWFIRGRRFSRE